MQLEAVRIMTENRSKDNVIFVGKKLPMAYVLAAVTQFGNGHDEIHLRARGRAISKAVDVAEMVRSRFIPGSRVREVSIGTETLQDENKKELNVSTIDITLAKS